MIWKACSPESGEAFGPTMFLKSWIQAHYAGARSFLAAKPKCRQVHRIDLTVRTPARALTPKKETPAPRDPASPRTARWPSRVRIARHCIAPVSAKS